MKNAILLLSKRRYQRTQRTMISASKCRPLNSAGRFRRIHRRVPDRPKSGLQHFQFDNVSLRFQRIIICLAWFEIWKLRRPFKYCCSSSSVNQMHAREAQVGAPQRIPLIIPEWIWGYLCFSPCGLPHFLQRASAMVRLLSAVEKSRKASLLDS